MGKGGNLVVDPEKKDSFDVAVDRLPPALANEYGIERYYSELQRCLQQYLEQHPMLKQVGLFRVTESPSIQHYRPGGGFKMPHFERAGYATTTRDRKSTRLNSSHLVISYSVFCLIIKNT